MRIYPWYLYGAPPEVPIQRRRIVQKEKKELVEEVKPVSSFQKTYNDLRGSNKGKKPR